MTCNAPLVGFCALQLRQLSTSFLSTQHRASREVFVAHLWHPRHNLITAAMSYPYSYSSASASKNANLPPRPAAAPAFPGPAFLPRQVAVPTPVPASMPAYSQDPTATSYPGVAPGNYTGFNSNTHYGAPPSTYSPVPHIVNPFPNPKSTHDSKFTPIDPEMQAQIAMQQSIYDPSAQVQPGVNGAVSTKDTASGTRKSVLSPDSSKTRTVIRSGGGQTWTDSSLLEWDPAHFRLFVGNLAGEVTDESLLKAFSKYPSVRKARVIRDKRTTKSKGYGFVSFEDGDEYFRAAKEMNGKYIGSHPVQLKKSTTEIRPVAIGKGGGKHGHAGRIEKSHHKKNKKKKDNGPKLLG